MWKDHIVQEVLVDEFQTLHIREQKFEALLTLTLIDVKVWEFEVFEYKVLFLFWDGAGEIFKIELDFSVL